MRFEIDRYAFVVPVLALFGAVGPLSYLELQPDVLVARFGFASYRIERADIAYARHAHWPAWGGIGWRIGPKVLGLIGSRRGVVEIGLARPYSHHVLVVPLGFTRLMVSLKDADGFLRELGVRVG